MKHFYSRILAFALTLLGIALLFGVAAASPPAQPQFDGLPPADAAFTPKQELGRDHYTAYIAHLIASPNPAFSNTLALVWSRGQQHLIYRASTDGGQNWGDEEVLAGSDEWGGAVGNISVAADWQAGGQYIIWYQLYGYAYPNIMMRYRAPDWSGPERGWNMERALPGTYDSRMKVTGLTATRDGTIEALVGKGLETLYYMASGDKGTTWTKQFEMGTKPEWLPNRTWLPVLAGAAKGSGITVAAWADTRTDERYHIITAIGHRSPDNTSSWVTYSFTETGEVNGGTQTHPAIAQLPNGGIGLTWEGSVAGDEDHAVKDIFYREWNPAKAGPCCAGWLTDSVRIATWPEQTESPQLVVDEATAQRYLIWQDAYDNLRIVYSYSADGVHWTAPKLVNAGSANREKMPTAAIAGGRLWVAWTDNVPDSHDMAIYATSRSLPELYPMPTATPANTPIPLEE